MREGVQTLVGVRGTNPAHRCRSCLRLRWRDRGWLLLFSRALPRPAERRGPTAEVWKWPRVAEPVAQSGADGGLGCSGTVTGDVAVAFSCGHEGVFGVLVGPCICRVFGSRRGPRRAARRFDF